MDAGSLAVLLIFGPFFAAVLGALLLIWKWLSPGQRTQFQTEEAKLIQELYQGLSKMEERVEALETILLDRERKEVKK